MFRRNFLKYLAAAVALISPSAVTAVNVQKLHDKRPIGWNFTNIRYAFLTQHLMKMNFIPLQVHYLFEESGTKVLLKCVNNQHQIVFLKIKFDPGCLEMSKRFIEGLEHCSDFYDGKYRKRNAVIEAKPEVFYKLLEKSRRYR